MKGPSAALTLTAEGPLTIVIFFARYPDEELLAGDAALKLGCSSSDVHRRLRWQLENGLVASSGGGPGSRQQATYTAGPRLLQMIGAARAATRNADACTPAA
jgi:hypothetical protein